MFEGRPHPGDPLDGPEVSIEFERPAQRDVDAAVAPGHRRRDRPFQSYTGPEQGTDQGVRTQFLQAMTFERPGLVLLPNNLRSGRFQQAHRSVRHFRSNAISRNQNHGRCHTLLAFGISRPRSELYR
jgi:hypothetical protein